MKTILLSALLCAAGFGAKCQTADASNSTACDAIVRFTAVDIATCAVVATDPTTYVVPAGTLAGTFFIPAAWVPSPPGVSYIIIAEVADAACGFPGVLVGLPFCGTLPTDLLPTCPACAPGVVDNPGPVFPAGSAGMVYPLIIHP